MPELFNATVFKVVMSFSSETISSTQLQKNWDVRREFLLSDLETEKNYFTLFFFTVHIMANEKLFTIVFLQSVSQLLAVNRSFLIIIDPLLRVHVEYKPPI